MMSLIKIIADICVANKIKFLMINGTLLGSWRHHDMIPWDEDADFLMYVDDQPLFINALKESKYSEVGYTLLPFSKRPQRSFKVYFHNTTCVKANCPWKFPSVDIILYNTDKNYLWFTDNRRIRIDLKYVFPITMRPLGSLWLQAPRDPLRLLPPTIDSICRTHVHNHRLERRQKSKKCKCSDLYNVYPFVQRTDLKMTIEALVINQKIIHIVIYPLSQETLGYNQ